MRQEVEEALSAAVEPNPETVQPSPTEDPAESDRLG